MEETIILYIDTSSNTEVEVGLIIRGQEKTKRHLLDRKRAQVVLPIIGELLHENNFTLDDLSGIQVNTGPGSFTGLRVGVSIANTLGTFLKIPINNQPIGMIVDPVYS